MDVVYFEYCLNHGIIPEGLDYIVEKNILDDPRLNYNNYYTSPEFILQKYVPKAMIQSEYMQPVVDQIIKDKQEYNNLVSLLDQINLKSQS